MKRVLTFAAIGALAFAAACSDDDTVEVEMDDDPMEEMADDVEDAMDDAGDAMEEAADDMEDAVD